MGEEVDGAMGVSGALRDGPEDGLQEGLQDRRIWRSVWSPISTSSVDGVRLLYVSLDGCARERALEFEAALGSEPDLGTLCGRGGPAVPLVAAVLAARSEGRMEAPAIAISVGAAVVRGVPTAARASLSARTVLRDGLVEASFGGGFARELSGTTDVLLVWGQKNGREPRWVIDLDESGAAALMRAPFEVDASAEQRASALLGRGGCALVVGPGADAGVPFAHIGSWTSGTGAPSLVGRGGVGHSMAAAGIAGVRVAVHGPSLGNGKGDDDSLLAALKASPRLIARASGGTLELGEVRPPGDGALADGLGGKRSSTKHGCVGCPTPCGWQFKGVSDGAEVVGRFAALQGFLESAMTTAFGTPVDAVEVVAECNRLGLDARSAARFLQLGDVAEHVRGRTPAEALRSMATPGTALHQRALRYRRSEDVEPAAPSHPADLVATLGRRLSARGPEPLRSLSVLGLEAAATESESVRADLAAKLGVVGLGEDVEENAGVLAHWHECLAAAIDQFGFCAFSGAALMADRVLSLDELGDALEPGMSGAALLGLGAELVALHRELWSQEAWDARASVVSTSALKGFASARAGRWADQGERTAAHAAVAGAAAVGVRSVDVLATGWLARRLARAVEHEALEGREGIRIGLEVGRDAEACTVGAVIEALLERAPRVRSLLVSEEGHLLPAVLIAGQAVGARTLVPEGEAVELLLVIPGG